MKWLTFCGALALSCAQIPSLAQSSSVLQGNERLACEAILCLSSSLQPSECKPSLNHYFDIRKYRKGAFDWSRTVDARNAFLNMCPAAGAQGMSERIKQITQGAGRCDPEYLNSTYQATLYRYKVRRFFGQDSYYTDVSTLPTVTLDKLPSYCVVYNDHEWTYDLSVKYVGKPLRGGYWVNVSDYAKEQAKWEAEFTGEWAKEWRYSLEHPRNLNLSGDRFTSLSP